MIIFISFIHQLQKRHTHNQTNQPDDTHTERERASSSIKCTLCIFVSQLYIQCRFECIEHSKTTTTHKKTTHSTTKTAVLFYTTAGCYTRTD